MDDDFHEPEKVLAALAGLDAVRQLGMLTEVMHDMIAAGVPRLEVYLAVSAICRRLHLDTAEARRSMLH